jgi:hypothetical protein
MRFYIKLILFIILFECASSSRVRGLAGDLAYEARVKFVLTFGSAADYEELVEDTQRMLAAQSGRLDVYEAGKRYRELLAEGLADAARRNVTLSEDEFSRLKAECERKAFGPVLDAMKARDGRARHKEQSDRAVSSEPPRAVW